MNCGCGKDLFPTNKTGKCRDCLNADPDYLKRRGEAIKRAFDLDPMKRQRQRDGIAAHNRSAKARARSGQLAREIRLWEHGLPKIDAAVRRRQAETYSNNRLADIPIERREEYKKLAKAYGATYARHVIHKHQEAVLRRGHA